MNFKYCYNNEIHKAFLLPISYNALIEDIKESFGESLPLNFALQYRDQDGDLVTLSSDIEYRAMMRFDTPKSDASMKIYIVSSKKSDDDKEGSFEVVEPSQSASEGVISDFSLNTDEDKLSEAERSISQEKRYSPSSDRAPVNSVQRSRVLCEDDLKEDQECPLEGENSINFDDEVPDMLIKARKDSEGFPSPSLSEPSELEIPVERREIEFPYPVQSRNYRSSELQDLTDDEDSDVENSRAIQQIDEFMHKLSAQKANEKFENLKMEFERTIIEQTILLNQMEIRKRQLDILIQDTAARTIQKAFRTQQAKKRFAKFQERYLRLQQRIFSLKQLKFEREARKLEADLNAPSYTPSADYQEYQFRNEIRLPEKNWQPDVSQSYRNEESNYYSEERSPSYKYYDYPSDHEAPVSQCSGRQNQYFYDFKNYHVKENSFERPTTPRDSQGEYHSFLQDFSEYPAKAEENEKDFWFQRMEAKLTSNYSYRVIIGTSSSLLFLGNVEGQGVVYKTIYLENNGAKPWAKCYVKPAGLLAGKTLEIYNVAVGELVPVILEVNGYFNVGAYSSHWKVIHENENGMVETVGEPFQVDFIIEPKNVIGNNVNKRSPYLRSNSISLYREEIDETEEYNDEDEEERQGGFDQEDEEEDEEEQERAEEEEEDEEQEEQEEEEEEENEEFFHENQEEQEEEGERQEEIQENEEEEEEDIDEAFSEKFKAELAKIREMRRIFPLVSLDEIIEFVDQRPGFTIEELLTSYLSLTNDY